MEKDVFQYRSSIIASYLPKIVNSENSGHFESENVINEFFVPDNRFLCIIIMTL